ncbi:hypothetical protein [Rhodococcus sp. ACS1]|nr:hypothetical protein [Rhodococcus sp. ACS1]
MTGHPGTPIQLYHLRKLVEDTQSWDQHIRVDARIDMEDRLTAIALSRTV